MAKIRIIDVPPGEAPDWVRKEWVGLELPVDLDVNEKAGFFITLKEDDGEEQSRSGYHVKMIEALDILSKKSEEAAQWWKDNFFRLLKLNPNFHLVFKKDVCELIN